MGHTFIHWNIYLHMHTDMYVYFNIFMFHHVYIFAYYICYIYIRLHVHYYIYIYISYFCTCTIIIDSPTRIFMYICMISTNMKRHLQWMLRWGVLIELGFGVHSNLNYFPVSKTAESFYTLCLANCVGKSCVVLRVSPFIWVELSWFGHRFACNHSSHTKGHPTSAGKYLGRESGLPLMTLYTVSVLKAGHELLWCIQMHP